ncbi:helix-turn-helix transcriptional regulator [Nitratireductor sp. ZSWI3]|uniref:helix-turn-helix domain-containing protein n=1 Tax=Nitratireductor sp. ZSWI3 TaxID=2966359 RepID=UPI00214FB757|nr:helix-turn-helix transcriptional regulator [Nitratireductor sp. ZSWI3]MCR4264904.1 helix-turn-helix transcriptional regulator [Nitratireductor sp. ZSWI3]
MSGRSAHLSDEQNARLAERIREEIARRRISRQRLADEACISLSTLEKALSGHRPFTLATIIRLEQAMGVVLREHNDVAAASFADGNGHAAEELGAYSRAAVSWLEGAYLTLRPSFGMTQAIFAYCIEISWDTDAARLSFHERERVDAAFSQQGVVSVPNLSGHVYLVTNMSGQYRVAILSRPSIAGEMFGILTTLRVGQGAQLIPASTPLALVPLAGVENPSFGRTVKGDRHYDDYAAVLRKALDEGYASFPTIIV